MIYGPADDKPVITKTQHYVWHIDGRTGSENHRYIDAWNVIGPGGEVLHGGCDAGCNIRSGRAYCRSRSEARAFVAGWGYAREYNLTASPDDYLKILAAADKWCATNKIGINLELECRNAFTIAAERRIARQPGGGAS